MADLIETPRATGSEEGLQVGEREFDRSEVRDVGREKTQLRAHGFNREADVRV